MGEFNPRRTNQINQNGTPGPDSDGLTQKLVTDLRSALESLRHSIQTAARRAERANDVPCSDVIADDG